MATATALSGCFNVPAAMKPVPIGLQEAPEDAPEEYQLGWNHGCESGLAAYGNQYYKTFYDFYYDPQLIRNPTYSKAWKDRYAHCRAMVNRTLRDGLLMGEGGGYAKGVFQGGGWRNTSDIVRGGQNFGLWNKHHLSLPGWGDWAWGAQAKSNGLFDLGSDMTSLGGTSLENFFFGTSNNASGNWLWGGLD